MKFKDQINTNLTIGIKATMLTFTLAVLVPSATVLGYVDFPFK